MTRDEWTKIDCRMRTKEQLAKIRKTLNHTAYDDALQVLINKSGILQQPPRASCAYEMKSILDRFDGIVLFHPDEWNIFLLFLKYISLECRDKDRTLCAEKIIALIQNEMARVDRVEKVIAKSKATTKSDTVTTSPTDDTQAAVGTSIRTEEDSQ